MAHCFLAAKSKLECKLGYFDLIGCDFLIDDNFKVLSWVAGAREADARRQGPFAHTLTTLAGPRQTLQSALGMDVSTRLTSYAAGTDLHPLLRAAPQARASDPQSFSGQTGEQRYRKEAISQSHLAERGPGPLPCWPSGLGVGRV